MWEGVASNVQWVPRFKSAQDENIRELTPLLLGNSIGDSFGALKGLRTGPFGMSRLY